jgi:DNA (cytosine-5)-methyltransferase 1
MTMITSKKEKKKTDFKAIDFFCGAGGMTAGFRKAGVNVIAGIDFDLNCKQTYEVNNKGSKFLLADVKKLTCKELQKITEIKPMDDKLIFIGCSPCQYWSIIQTNKTKSEVSKNLLKDFQTFVDYFRPGYIVIENVPGIMHKTKETPLNGFLEFLDKSGYSYKHEIVNASHFGVPQTRRRFLLIASRVNHEVILPKPNKKIVPTVREFISPDKGFPVIGAGHQDSSKKQHFAAKLQEINLKRLANTKKDGGTRMSYASNRNLAIATHYKNSNFHDSYGRLFWDKPAPTITTKFMSISNGRFAHPEQNRGLSLREGATLQTFPKNYQFIADNQGAMAKLVGNAVPPKLSFIIANTIINS